MAFPIAFFIRFAPGDRMQHRRFGLHAAFEDSGDMMPARNKMKLRMEQQQQNYYLFLNF
jgi:hypothetical protein